MATLVLEPLVAVEGAAQVGDRVAVVAELVLERAEEEESARRAELVVGLAEPTTGTGEGPPRAKKHIRKQRICQADMTVDRAGEEDEEEWGKEEREEGRVRTVSRWLSV